MRRDKIVHVFKTVLLFEEKCNLFWLLTVTQRKGYGLNWLLEIVIVLSIKIIITNQRENAVLMKDIVAKLL